MPGWRGRVGWSACRDDDEQRHTACAVAADDDLALDLCGDAVSADELERHAGRRRGAHRSRAAKRGPCGACEPAFGHQKTGGIGGEQNSQMRQRERRGGGEGNTVAFLHTRGPRDGHASTSAPVTSPALTPSRCSDLLAPLRTVPCRARIDAGGRAGACSLPAASTSARTPGSAAKHCVLAPDVPWRCWPPWSARACKCPCGAYLRPCPARVGKAVRTISIGHTPCPWC